MGYDTTKHNLNWNSFSDAKSHIERWHKSSTKPFKMMHNTYATFDPYADRIYINLHWTDIYQIEQRHDKGEEFPHSVVTLNSGGYRTVTTKDRINRFLPLGYRVVQRNYNWILQILETLDGESQWNNQELFYDGMQIEIE